MGDEAHSMDVGAGRAAQQMIVSYVICVFTSVYSQTTWLMVGSSSS